MDDGGVHVIFCEKRDGCEWSRRTTGNSLLLVLESNKFEGESLHGNVLEERRRLI